MRQQRCGREKERDMDRKHRKRTREREIGTNGRKDTARYGM